MARVFLSLYIYIYIWLQEEQILQELLKKKYIFFDDNNENKPTRQQLSTGIEWVKIPQGRQTEDPHEHYLPHASHGAWGKMGVDKFHKASGLKGIYLDQLMTDLQADKVSAIVLDWDRTVLIMEGMVTGKKKTPDLDSLLAFYKKLGLFPADMTPTKMAHYFLHDPSDPQRIEKLSHVLRYAQSKKVPIFILTNNTMPMNNPNIIVDILREIGVYITQQQVIGGGSAYSFTKGETIIHYIKSQIERVAAQQYDLLPKPSVAKSAPAKSEPAWRKVARASATRRASPTKKSTLLGGKRTRRKRRRKRRKRRKHTKRRNRYRKTRRCKRRRRRRVRKQRGGNLPEHHTRYIIHCHGVQLWDRGSPSLFLLDKQATLVFFSPHGCNALGMMRHDDPELNKAWYGKRWCGDELKNCVEKGTCWMSAPLQPRRKEKQFLFTHPRDGPHTPGGDGGMWRMPIISGARLKLDNAMTQNYILTCDGVMANGEKGGVWCGAGGPGSGLAKSGIWKCVGNNVAEQIYSFDRMEWVGEVRLGRPDKEGALQHLDWLLRHTLSTRARAGQRNNYYTLEQAANIIHTYNNVVHTRQVDSEKPYIIYADFCRSIPLQHRQGVNLGQGEEVIHRQHMLPQTKLQRFNMGQARRLDAFLGLTPQQPPSQAQAELGRGRRRERPTPPTLVLPPVTAAAAHRPYSYAESPTAYSTGGIIGMADPDAVRRVLQQTPAAAVPAAMRNTQ